MFNFRRKKETEKKESHNQIQIKLVKSQTRGLWITSILALVVGVLSLVLNYLNYLNENKEDCIIRVNLIKSDYKTDYSGTVVCCNEKGEAMSSAAVMIKYESEIINNSKSPISVISYYVIKEKELKRLNISTFNWEKILKNETNQLNFQKTELSKGIIIEPGNSDLIKFETYFDINVTARKKVKPIIKDITKINRGEIWISDVMFAFYLNRTDFFGNFIDCTLDKDGNMNGVQYDSSKCKDDPFYFIIETAKGNFISKKITWYSKDSFPPLSRFDWENKN